MLMVYMMILVMLHLIAEFFFNVLLVEFVI